MINNIFQNKYDQIKKFIFTKGRLFERILFTFFFEDGSKKQCLNALKVYQNEDGGFGNGIEPDLLCPHSSGIGAETALFYLDMLDTYPTEILKHLQNWILNTLNQEGFIPHPFKELYNYPHQKWWENPDNNRILSIAGFLKKFKIENRELYNSVESYFETSNPIEELTFYDYPRFVFLKHLKNTTEQEKEYNKIIQKFPQLQKENVNHYPLWSRYWYHINSEVDKTLLDETAEKFIKDIEEGGLPNPYENLLWWKPIFTLDGLILLKRRGYIE